MGPQPRSSDNDVYLSSNWSGQVLTGDTYTGVGGQWTVPSVTPSTSPEYSATWIGIDGWTNSSLIQTGTTQETSGANTSYFAWYELLPGASIAINAPVSPGDVMQAAISETSPGEWSIAIQDTTANWVYSNSFAYSTPGASAEWIEEAPTIGTSQSTLAGFGSAMFSDMQADGSTSSSVLNPVVMMNPAGTAFIAYPGTYATNSFTDFYGAPPPVVTSVSPSQGAVGGGTNVIISGDFLLNVNGVAFGPFSATSYALNGNGTVSAVSPPQGAGTVDVRVSTPGGYAALSTADQFTYASSSPQVPGPTPTPTPTPTAQHGYWLVGGDGGIFTFGSAQFWGSTGSLDLQRPVVGITPTQTHDGYWLVASDGGIFAFGSAGFFGSIPGLGYRPAGTPGNVKRLNAPVVGMVPSADGGGYFMVASDGGVFAFGDAKFEGSCPGIGGCSGSAVAVMPDGSGNGYWLVTTTGHVYSFGDATFYGAPTTGETVTSAVRTPDGKGYWILFADGSIAEYGDAAVSRESPRRLRRWPRPGLGDLRHHLRQRLLDHHRRRGRLRVRRRPAGRGYGGKPSERSDHRRRRLVAVSRFDGLVAGRSHALLA